MGDWEKLAIELSLTKLSWTEISFYHSVSMSDDLDTYKEPITYSHKMKLGIKLLKRYLHYNASFHSSSWCVI